ncbi:MULTISPECIES: type II secretion system protein [Cyanophyceae]|uniref:pilus assembly FimT family protein n=1 Tax=Cyanophyceae TaxID=3028117 RepID=UPI0016881767|nr:MULTISPECIES: type II secretion system protein [Cyanophyceae]MBD1919299.1 type II secretion system protein [Phormidium sp. FACHB-77]MBD2033018.1 type II secretion system protein [Phormidium sp. FACHB-322]MBD2054206.1 type II secretion system protein [Leptolyngbya sp. FACHB-60]
MTQLLRRAHRPLCRQANSAGFTLIEGLIVVVIVGLMAAIAAPSWFGFVQQRKINATRDMVYHALRATQADAMQHRHDRRFSIREHNGRIEWASHPESTLPAQVVVWQPLEEGVGLANIDNTLVKTGAIHYAKFDMHGNVKGQLGTVTVAMSGNQQTHRCVVVSTLIGAMRKGEGHTQANGNGRFCY